MKKQENRITRIIIRISLGLCTLGFIIFLGNRINIAFSQNRLGLNEQLPASYSLSSEDSSLIAINYRRQIKVNQVYKSKLRNPVSLVYFGKEYQLIIYKIDLFKDISLKNLFHIQIKSMDQSTGISYLIVDHNLFFNFKYKAGLIPTVSKIFFTLSGDSLQTLSESDSMISYHLLCNNFSLRYSEQGPVDIFVAGKERGLGTTTQISMDLLFLNRNHAVYLLIMTPKDSKSTIAPDLLYNIVTGTK